MPYLHLPVQSGCDKMLKAMNRAIRRELSARDREDRARRGPTSPSRATSSSAFPGEPDADFEATLTLVEAVGYASAFSFKYSPRPARRRRRWTIRLRREVKDERLQRLQALVIEKQMAFNRASVGKDIDILIERKGRHAGQMIGRSPWLQSVHVETERAARRHHRRDHDRRVRTASQARSGNSPPPSWASLRRPSSGTIRAGDPDNR